MNHRSRQLFLAGLSVFLATSGGTTVLAQIADAPRMEHGVADERSFGTIVENANIPGNEAIRFDPVIEMPPGKATLEQLEIAYRQKLDSRQYADAVTIAQRMVKMAGVQHGADSIQSAYAQSDLGAALHHAGSNIEAIEPLRNALSSMKEVRGLFHPDLTGTYAYLGMALQGVGDHKEAIEAISRAQHLTHRESGTQNLQQMSLVYAKANSMEAMGEYWETEQLYRAAVKIAHHNYGKDSLEALPSMYRLAEWLRYTHAFKPALSTYREALRLIQPETGEDIPEMIPAMRGMAMTFLLKQGMEADRGLRLNRRIVAVTERFPDRFSPYERIMTHLDLGDWLILFRREEQAWDQYAKAWELTRMDQDTAIDWRQYFAKPQLIYAGPPLTIDFLGYNVVGKDQWNEFVFQIETDGRPSHVQITDSNMHRLTRSRSVDFLRLGRFRPAMIEGQAMVTEHFEIKRTYPTNPPADYGVVDVGDGL